MDMEKLDKPRHDQLFAMSERVHQLWRQGEVEAAISLGEQYWSSLPEPRHDWEWLSQAALFFAKKAANNDCPEQGRVWLERARLAYGPDKDGDFTARQMIDFTDGMLSLAEGDDERAFRLFKASYDFLGKQAFAGEDPKHWKFFATTAGIPLRTKQASTKTLKKLAAEGDVLHEKGDLTGAVDVWSEALNRMSEPTEHPMAMWFFASIGDVEFEAGHFNEALSATGQALIAGGTGEGFVWLRRGQSLVESGEVSAGVEALTSAYMLEGEDIFDDEDPKYESLLRERGIIS